MLAVRILLLRLTVFKERFQVVVDRQFCEGSVHVIQPVNEFVDFDFLWSAIDEFFDVGLKEVK